MLALAAFVLVSSGAAQTPPPPAAGGPVYTVQPGDSLWDIAARFGVSLPDLMAANSGMNADALSVGAQLVIPGLEGLQGQLTTRSVAYGDSLPTLARRYNTTPDTLVRLNHLTSPADLFPGSILVILEPGDTPPQPPRMLLHSGQTLLEAAAASGVNPWTLAISNALTATWQALPGDSLRLPTSTPAGGPPNALPVDLAAVQLLPEPFVQGKGAEVVITGTQGMSLSGSLAGHTFPFFPQEGGYVGLQGLHALMEPGLYTLEIHGTLADGTPLAFSQAVLVKDGEYVYDPVLAVSPETIDPAVTKPEEAEWAALAAAATPEKLWNGKFTSPVPPDYTDCWPSRYGNRRSFNGSAYTYFHSGLDFCGNVGTEIYAPAAGRVVFTGPLTVRGNATMIDHGWGVYSGYMHQSEIKVKVGDLVTPGQLIGLVGGTGRVTGPHLHWEFWVGGVQVDPMDFLTGAFP
jgi:murein DD-endopeptidase MepM/ murein hydrolase activator NlpD